jgi:hypothetical protein
VINCVSACPPSANGGHCASKAVIAFAMVKYLYKPSTMNDRDLVAFMRIAVASFILSE